MIQAINSAMCIGIYHIAGAHVLQTSKLVLETNKYFHLNKIDTGYHKALSLSLSLILSLSHSCA
jgi:hypothetical protein